MAMTVVVTRNAPMRYRGFLASCMLEIASGVYTAPRMNRGVRERVWRVCLEWSSLLPEDGCILMTWRDSRAPGGQAVLIIGEPAKTVCDHEGFLLARRELDESSLKTE
jgi:CRISPR-associated protein Cas2